MTFRLDMNKSLKSNIKRLARRQMAKMEKTIQADVKPRAEIVHSIRKCLKRIRALLRLVRPEVSKADFRRENESFRDAGRLLATVRDAKMLVDALDKLLNGGSEQHLAKGYMDLRQLLQDQQNAVQTQVLDAQDALGQVQKVVEKEQGCVGTWAASADEWPALRRGLKKGYQQTRCAWQEALADPTPELLHEWRKQAKYLWHQFEILEPLSNYFKKRTDDLHELGQLLGDDHDLVLLRDKIGKTHVPSDQDARAELLRLIDGRREQLLRKAFQVGSRLLEHTPQEFNQQLKLQFKVQRASQTRPV